MWPAEVALTFLVLASCRVAPVEHVDPGAGESPAQTAPDVPEAAPAAAPAATTNVPDEVQRAAVEAACKELVEARQLLSCEGAHYLGDFIVLRAVRELASGQALVWYVTQRSDGRYSLLQTAYNPPRGEEVVFSHDALCNTDAAPDGKTPAGFGLVRAELRDLDLDERDDLLLECRSDTLRGDSRAEGHYLRYCPGSRHACEEEIWLRRVRNGHLEMDVDVEFVDGWIRQTIRVYEDSTGQGDRKL